MLCIVGERERRRNPRVVRCSHLLGVLALPAMIGLHATLYPELDVRTGASPSLRRSLRQGAVYGEFSLSLVAVPGTGNSVSLAELGRLVVNRRSRTYLVQYYARAFGELEIRYVWQRRIATRLARSRSPYARTLDYVYTVH